MILVLGMGHHMAMTTDSWGGSPWVVFLGGGLFVFYGSTISISSSGDACVLEHSDLALGTYRVLGSTKAETDNRTVYFIDAPDWFSKRKTVLIETRSGLPTVFTVVDTLGGREIFTGNLGADGEIFCRFSQEKQ